MIEFNAAFSLSPAFCRTVPSHSGGLSLGEGWMPLHDAVGVNCEKGATTENQGECVGYAKGCVR